MLCLWVSGHVALQQSRTPSWQCWRLRCDGARGSKIDEAIILAVLHHWLLCNCPSTSRKRACLQSQSRGVYDIYIALASWARGLWEIKGSHDWHSKVCEVIGFSIPWPACVKCTVGQMETTTTMSDFLGIYHHLDVWFRFVSNHVIITTLTLNHDNIFGEAELTLTFDKFGYYRPLVKVDVCARF